MIVDLIWSICRVVAYIMQLVGAVCVLCIFFVLVIQAIEYKTEKRL